MFGCQQVRINPDKELKAILEYLCSESNKLNNCVIYYARQLYFKTGNFINKFALINELKQNPHYGSMYSQVAQQTIMAVAESFKASFLDADELSTFGEKTGGWQESGKRVSRGLYRTANNWDINADGNGAANILRKVATTLGFNLDGVVKGALTTPLRSRFWTLKESHVL